MITFKIKDAQRLFFDSPVVIAAVDEATRVELSRSGAFIMTAAKRSIRKARRKRKGELSDEERDSLERRVKAWAAAGKTWAKPQPPMQSSRPGEPPRSKVGYLKKFLYFAYDPNRRSVVIGPAKLNGVKGHDVPETLEYGGPVRLKDGKTVVIEPRPYMAPAYESAKKDLVRKWRDSVRRAA